MTVDPPAQTCPLCGAIVPLNPRYPTYVCRACIETATTIDGQPAEIVQSHAFRSGAGLRLRSTGVLIPDDTLTTAPAGSPIDAAANCVVRGTLCHAAEAHMGGIVVTPAHGATGSARTHGSGS